ncbi:MAG: hypothetical protein AAGJ40_06365 [Planctomycetota bacterium]
MPPSHSWPVCSVLCALLSFAGPADADEAAANYMFAVLELDTPLPMNVRAATTDDPDHGFGVPLSDKQSSYLKQRFVASALSRFDEATSYSGCAWSRYTRSSWSAAHLNERLHRLARVALLQARVHYESGRWIEGNQSVERVRVMARDMTLQARPFEHQCFMVENMAIGTAAAYILQLPRFALADLLARHRGLEEFRPKAAMLKLEADRMRVLADELEGGQVAVDNLIEFLAPHLMTTAEQQRFAMLSRDAATDEVRGFSSFLSEHSQLMGVSPNEAEQQIANVYHRHAELCPLVASFGKPWFGDYRENAQSICRGFMIGEVIGRLHDGNRDFRHIEDPYSSKPLRFQVHGIGFTLTSALKHHSHIDLRFGIAGADSSAQSTTPPSGQAGRTESENDRSSSNND